MRILLDVWYAGMLILCTTLQTLVFGQEAEPGADNRSTIVSSNRNNEVIKFFSGNVTVASGDTLKTVVVMGGDATIDGHINEDIVIMGGKLIMNGSADGDVVVMGGKLTMNGSTHGDLVVLGSKASISSTATVGGDLVVLGSKNEVDENVNVRGDKVIMIPWLGNIFSMASVYVKECLLKGRFFALSVPWTMAFLAAIMIISFLLAILFPGTFSRSIDIVNNRMLAAGITGLLVPIAMGPVMFVLFVSVIGIPAIPVLIVVLKWATFIGMAAIAAHVGKQIIKGFSRSENMPLVVPTLLGIIIIGALSIIPFAGGFTTVIIFTFGTGVGVYTLFEMIRDTHRCIRSGKGPSAPSAENVPVNVNTENQVSTTVNISNTTEAGNVEKSVATFWPRAGAALIDIFLVMSLYGMSIGTFFGNHGFPGGHHGGPAPLLILLIYLTIMWNWKQTTVGGLIFKLKIFRSDNSQFTLGVAIVRALGLLLSIIPFGLGFIWIAWDSQRQGWHDKIAGTMVYKVTDRKQIM